jgi:ribosome-binding factor A
MTRRTQRIESLIRKTIGTLLISKMSDPRIDPARTSITRVEVPADLLTAKVFISVMGTEAEQRTTLRALQHASGHVQQLMMREIELRNTPILTFELDVQFKKTVETLAVIQQAMEELRRKEELRGGPGPAEPSETETRNEGEGEPTPESQSQSEPKE